MRANITGKEADEEVGVVYFGERYLIPRLGRWATPDPLHVHAVGGGEALNSYHYVSGNLLQARDPLGLDCAPGTSCVDDAEQQSDDPDDSTQPTATPSTPTPQPRRAPTQPRRRTATEAYDAMPLWLRVLAYPTGARMAAEHSDWLTARQEARRARGQDPVSSLDVLVVAIEIPIQTVRLRNRQAELVAGGFMDIAASQLRLPTATDLMSGAMSMTDDDLPDFPGGSIDDYLDIPGDEDGIPELPEGTHRTGSLPHPNSDWTDSDRRGAWRELVEDPASPLTTEQRGEIVARGYRGPQRTNPDTGELETMELSHEPTPRREGGTAVVPRWPADHAAVDPYRRLRSPH